MFGSTLHLTGSICPSAKKGMMQFLRGERMLKETTYEEVSKEVEQFEVEEAKRKAIEEEKGEIERRKKEEERIEREQQDELERRRIEELLAQTKVG